MKLYPELNFKACITHVQYNLCILRLRMLHKLHNYTNRQTSLMLYKMLISPVIDNGDIVYHGISQKEMDKLQRPHNGA